MKIRYLIYTLVLLIPFKVMGANCDYQDVARYQALASNIKFNYEFVESSKSFNIIVTNMPNELYIESTSNDYIFSSITAGSSETVLYGYGSGNYRFRIVSYDEACDGATIANSYVTLPYYNNYYNDPVCDDALEYSLCQKWIKHNLSHEAFVKDVENYKKILEKEPEVVNEEEEKDFFNKIIVLFLDNYFIILFSIIAICSVLIVVLSRRGRFDLR